MIGAPQTALFPPPLPRRTDREPAAVAVKGLSGGALKKIDFTARSGEVVGFAGLEGSGVATLFGLLFGTQKASAGEAIFPDSLGLPRGPTEAARRGIALVPADRRRNGLMLDKSVLFNISHVAIGALKDGAAVVQPWDGAGAGLRQIDRLRIKTGSPDALAGQLSGGNQQKTVVGKWLEVAPRVDSTGRPHARSRCRRQARNLCFDPPDFRRRAHRSVQLDRVAGTGRAVRSNYRSLSRRNRRRDQRERDRRTTLFCTLSIRARCPSRRINEGAWRFELCIATP